MSALERQHEQPSADHQAADPLAHRRPLAQEGDGEPAHHQHAQFVHPGDLGPIADLTRAEVAAAIAKAQGSLTIGDAGRDETLDAMRAEMHRFAETEVVPHAHEWHLKNEYIPMESITKMAEMGVFGLTIPEEFGGLGLGKESMCVASEELSRGYIGVGSLGTRSEIAGELILQNGTAEQKAKYLPRIASGEILPTAVFTEPNTGSDLASVRTRAMKTDGGYKVTGRKIWTSFAHKANYLIALVRTSGSPEQRHVGLTQLIIDMKTPGTSIRPIFNIHGGHDFNEVTFDAVFVLSLIHISEPTRPY